MATIDLEALTPDVVLHVPQCPDPLVQDALRAAAVDLCSRSLCWAEDQDPEPVQAGDWPYQVMAPAHGSVRQVLAVVLDDRRLEPVTLPLLDRMPGWQDRTGTPTAYYMVARDAVRPYPLPEQSGVLRLRVAYAPRADATVLEEFLGRDHRETLVHGALRRLMAMPRAWASPEGMAYHTAKFEQGVVQAAVSVAHSGTTAPLWTQMRPFA